MNITPMNSTARKIHNLLSSGAVTVTGPTQPRILKQRVLNVGQAGSQSLVSATVANTSVGAGAATTAAAAHNSNRCYVCDDVLNSGQAQHMLAEMETSHTTTKFPNKIGELIGPGYMVLVSVYDVICSRCTNLINYLDRLENDVERVRTNLLNLLQKKYGIVDDDDDGDDGGTTSLSGAVMSSLSSNTTTVSCNSTPPVKIQKLNTGSGAATLRSQADDGAGELHRKLIHSPVGKQQPPGK